MKHFSKDAPLLLGELRSGKQDALAEIVPFLYNEMRSMAASCLNSERREHTLQPSAQVREAYLRFVVQKPIQEQDPVMGKSSGRVGSPAAKLRDFFLNCELTEQEAQN